MVRNNLRRRLWTDRSIRLKGAIVVALPLLGVLAMAGAGSQLATVFQVSAVHAINTTDAVAELGDLEAAVEELRSIVLSHELGAPVTGSVVARAEASIEANLILLDRTAKDDHARVVRIRDLARDIFALLDELAVARPHRVGAIADRTQEVLDAARIEIDAFAQAERVEVRSDLAAITASTRTIRLALLLAVLLSLAAAGLALAVFSRGITRRLAALQANAARLARGESLAPMASADDEIGALDRTLQQSAGLLEARQRELVGARGDLERLLELSPASIFTVDAQTGQATYISPSPKANFGHDAKQLDEIGFWERLIHPEDRARVLETYASVPATGPAKLEYRMLDGEGRYRWVLEELLPVRDDHGRVVTIIGASMDVTDQVEQRDRLVQIQDELVRREAQLSDAQRMAHLGSWEWDAESNELQWSKELYRISGYEPGEVTPSIEMVLERTHPDDRERIAETTQRAVLSGGSVTYEQRIIRPDGKVRHLDCTLTMTLAADGAPLRMLGSAIDITHQAQARDALLGALAREQEAAEGLRENASMRDSFLTAVSHELRTPLTSVLGFALTLDTMVGADSPEAPLVEPLVRNARKLERLLGDLLDLDRMRRGVQALNITSVDLRQMAASVVQGSDFLLGRQVAIETAPLRLDIDGPKVERILENLLANAAKYAPTGRIWIRAESTLDGGVTLFVEDEGPSVPEALMEALFEPFRQGPNVPAHAPGVGIGLSLVRSFASMHGARTWVQDRPGGGASFAVEFPPGTATGLACAEIGLVGTGASGTAT